MYTPNLLSQKINEMTTAGTAVSDIINLYKTYGHKGYDGEPVSQASHMIQCAMLAIRERESDELVIGAFLHDIGHLLKHEEHAETMGNYGVVNHEGIGAVYLQQRGFSERVYSIVNMHVEAKRYLVATDEMYEEKLSPASLETLKWQGGPMSPEEATRFSKHPFFDDIIKVRLWDESAKDTEAYLLPLSFFQTLIRNYLTDRNYTG